MTFYRQKLLDAVRGLVGDGEFNLRLTHAAGHLIQIDDDDVPADMLAAFERVRDPLIQAPMVSRGKMLPRDLEPSAARAAAQGVVNLLAAERGDPSPSSRSESVDATAVSGFHMHALREWPKERPPEPRQGRKVYPYPCGGGRLVKEGSGEGK